MEKLVIAFQLYEGSIDLSAALLFMAAAGIVLALQREVLRREQWVKYFGLALLTLAWQHTILSFYDIGFKEFNTAAISVLSVANNLLILAAGRALLHHRPYVGPVFIWIGLATLAPRVAPIILGRPETWWSRLPDAAFSSYCLVLLGFAMFIAIRTPIRWKIHWRKLRRQVRAWVFGFSILLSTGAYCILVLTYAMVPEAGKSLFQGLSSIDDPMKAVEAMASGVALALKIPLIAGAHYLIIRSLTVLAPNALRQTLKHVNQGQIEYLSSDGILKAIGASANADVVELCMRLPNTRLNKVVWMRWKNPASPIAENRKVNYERGDFPSDRPGILRALEQGEMSSSLDQSFDRSRVRKPRSSITSPIFYHGAVIGCLKLDWDFRWALNETIVQRMHLVADQLAPSVESFRRLAALHEIGERFNRVGIWHPDLTEMEVARHLIRVVYETLSPVASGISLEIGFRGICAIRNNRMSGEGLIDHEPKAPKVSKELQRLLVEQEILTRTTELEVGGVRIGRLVITTEDKSRDGKIPPARSNLAADWLLRDTVTRLMADAVFDAYRVKLWANLSRLQVSLTEKSPTNVDAWFRGVGQALKEAGILWVGAACTDRSELLGDPEAQEIVEGLGEPVARYSGSGVDLFRLPEPRGETNNVVRLSLSDQQDFLWLGIAREGFRRELKHLWPWRIYLERVALAAGAALANIEVLRMRREAVEFQGIATASVATGTLVHQIGNLTQNLKFGIDNLEMKLKNGETAVEVSVAHRLGQLRDSIHRLKELTLLIMDVTRLDERKPCVLREAAEKAHQLFADTLRQHLIAVEIDIDQSLEADVPFYVATLVLANLVSNGIDSIDLDGTIRIEARDRGDHVECQVTDSGAGVKGEDAMRIFELNFTTKDNSHGIGLYLARRVLFEHRGNISLTSSLPGHTQFTVVLPGRHKENDLGKQYG